MATEGETNILILNLMSRNIKDVSMDVAVNFNLIVQNPSCITATGSMQIRATQLSDVAFNQ